MLSLCLIGPDLLLGLVNNSLSSSASKVISKGYLLVLVEAMVSLQLIRVGSSVVETETDEVASIEGVEEPSTRI